MKNAHLGTLEVSRIGLGAMTMAGTYTSEGALDNAESIRTIHRAFDLGVTHIDTAEIYGPFLSEEIVTTCPERCLRMTGSTARATFIGPRRLTASWRSICSGVSSSK